MYPDTQPPIEHPAYRRGVPPGAPRRARRGDGGPPNGLWLALGTGALAGALGAAWYARRRDEQDRRRRPPDDAPARASRLARDRSRPLTGRTVTIAKPRAEVYAFWRDFANLPRFMDHVEAVEAGADGTAHRWTLSVGRGGRPLAMETRIVHEVEGEEVIWRTLEGSDVEAEGSVRFRDAPGGRGTEVASVVRYRQPGGALGLAAAKLLQIDPKTETRRALKRLKMLLETGEIATSANRVADARPDPTRG